VYRFISQSDSLAAYINDELAARDVKLPQILSVAATDQCSIYMK
jgi:hypothetical protein